MNIGILGASSQIAKDLILSFYDNNSNHEVVMFSRSPEKVADQFKKLDKRLDYPNLAYSDFSSEHSFDVLINLLVLATLLKRKRWGLKFLKLQSNTIILRLTI
jgi:putative NADH-flavin reductase